MIQTIFLDRDGVINRNRDDYVKSWEEFEFLPGAVDALQRLAELRCKVVVITNQSIVNRGIASREAVEDINRRMLQEVAIRGGRIDAVLYCPHRPDEGCRCRKPKPGLLYKARDELNVDLSAALLVGDRISDLEAARAAACRASILVLSGRQSPLNAARDGHGHPQANGTGFYVAKDLNEAVDLIGSVFRRAD
ncbi:MAG: D-glycero-beta-D-manno-heptose 1,7-bisphosphate 7-phosphatase [Chloroflexi bacterium]|nr:D-glycero-beta-D-manno-heptose 1,7-bisphosphate 7-phosphatase [Chloroflexota bacterium]